MPLVAWQLLLLPAKRNEERVKKAERARADSDRKSKRIENAAQVRVQVGVHAPAEVVRRVTDTERGEQERIRERECAIAILLLIVCVFFLP